MKFNRIAIASILASSVFLTSCATVETGEIGLYKTFNGKIEPEELGQGFHQDVIGDVLVFSVKEILINAENLQPQTKDKTIMKDFDVRVTYSVEPSAVADLYSKYSTSYHSRNDRGEIFPMTEYVRPFINSAVFEAVAEYPALEVSNSRAEIADKIKLNVVESLRKEGLETKIRVNNVVIGTAQLPDELAASVNAVVAAQSKLKEKEFEVQTAEKEAERIRLISQGTSDNYIRLIEAEALGKAAEKGSLIIVPKNFTGLGNFSK